MLDICIHNSHNETQNQEASHQLDKKNHNNFENVTFKELFLNFHINILQIVISVY